MLTGNIDIKFIFTYLMISYLQEESFFVQILIKNFTFKSKSHTEFFVFTFYIIEKV